MVMLNTKIHACANCYFQKQIYHFVIDDRSTTTDIHTAEIIIFSKNTPLSLHQDTAISKEEILIGGILRQCIHTKEKIFIDDPIISRTYQGYQGTASVYHIALNTNKRQLEKSLANSRVFIVTNNRRLEALLPLILPTHRPMIILHSRENAIPL